MNKQFIALTMLMVVVFASCKKECAAPALRSKVTKTPPPAAAPLPKKIHLFYCCR